MVALFPPLAEALKKRMQFGAATPRLTQALGLSKGRASKGQWGTLYVIQTPFFKFGLTMICEIGLTFTLTVSPSRPDAGRSGQLTFLLLWVLSR